MRLGRLGIVAAFAAAIALPLLAQENRPWSVGDIPGACDAPVLVVMTGQLSPEGFAPRQGRPGYNQALRASGVYERFDGWFLASGAPTEVLEGAWRPNQDMVQIAEFPCLEAARGWYFSTDHQAILPLRARAGEFRLAVWPKRAKEGMNWVADRATRQSRQPAADRGERKVGYQCSDGQDRSVTYVGRGAEVVGAGGAALSLTSAPATDGVRYAGGGVVLRGFASAITLEGAGERPLICVEAGAPG